MSDTLEGVSRGVLDLVGLAAELEGFADRALGGEQPQAGDGEVAAFENAQDFDADGARRADHGDVLRPHDP
jgi:hypothetical protein